MTNSTKQDPKALIGTFFRDDDIVFEVVEYKAGWFTSKSADGIEQKDRLADITQYQSANGFDTDEEKEAATGKQSMNSQLLKYRANYKTSIAASGRKSLNNGDPVATALEYIDLEDLYDAVAELFEVDLRVRYERLNLGSQRMNLGNRIRSAYKKEVPHVVAWVNKRAEIAAKAKGDEA